MHSVEWPISAIFETLWDTKVFMKIIFFFPNTTSIKLV